MTINSNGSGLPSQPAAIPPLSSPATVVHPSVPIVPQAAPIINSTAAATNTATGLPPAAATAPVSTVAGPLNPALDTSNAIPLPNYKLNERLLALENANKAALSQNQSLALKNDNLQTQVLSLQSERGTQMFLYGALVLLIGLSIGYMVGRAFAARQRSFWR